MSKQFTYWQDDVFFIGYINDYPEYLTQGYTLDELQKNLKEIILDIESKEIPYIRQVAELELA